MADSHSSSHSPTSFDVAPDADVEQQRPPAPRVAATRLDERRRLQDPTLAPGRGLAVPVDRPVLGQGVVGFRGVVDLPHRDHAGRHVERDGELAVRRDYPLYAAIEDAGGALLGGDGFREDLFYRLNVFPIEVPALRERVEDIPALVRHFIARFNAQEGKSVLDASAETMDMLARYEWKGNVRQLENAIFRAVVLCDGDYLTMEDFPQISGMAPTLADAPAPASDAPVPSAPDGEEAGETAGSDGGQSALDELGVTIFDDGGHLRPLEAIERDLIAFAIETYSGRMAEVARRLGVGRSTLYRKVREYDLDVDNFREAG